MIVFGIHYSSFFFFLLVVFFISLNLSTGYMPLLRLYAPVPSALPDPNLSVPHEQKPYDFDSLFWDFEIPLNETISTIEKTMYPFKEV